MTDTIPDSRLLDASWLPAGPGMEPSVVLYARRDMSPGSWRRADEALGLPEGARRLSFPLLTADGDVVLVQGRALEVPEALQFLIHLGEREVQPSVRAWQLAALVARRIHEGGMPPPGVDDTDAKLQGLAGSMPPASHALIVDEAAGADGMDITQLFQDDDDGVPPTLTAAQALRGFLSEALRSLSLGLGLDTPLQTTSVSGGRSMRGLRLRLELPTGSGDWILTATGVDGEGGPTDGELANLVLEDAARLVPALGRWHRNNHSVELTTEEAGQLVGAVPEFDARGVIVELPRSFVEQAELPIEARIRFRKPRKGGGAKAGNTPNFRLDDLVGYDLDVALGDRDVSAAELRELARDARQLIQVGGEWVALTDSTRRQLDALSRAVDERDATMAASRALTASLAGGVDLNGTIAEVTEIDDQRLRRALEYLRSPDTFPTVDPTGQFEGTLREYQQSGLSWLSGMASIPLGACLADDMGLGKTVQLIALLDRMKADRDGVRALIVCPTSLIGNWERELARFGPSLTVHVHHGPDRGAHLDEFDAADVCVTSYGLVARDADMLVERAFDVAAFDEAQAVKNPDTEQARATRRLNAAMRIALTGTPIENRLMELWAILDLLNPGLLGSLYAFRRTYALPIEQAGDEAAVDRLRAITRPFILRRVKDDPGVAPELPEKDEHTIACTLTAEQATLYQAALDAAMGDVRQRDGIGRRGAVLALLTRLKQICNHPLQFTEATGVEGASSEIAGRSGKLDRLVSMLDEVTAENDRALIFSQYAAMAGIIQRHLAEEIEADILFMHGGVPRKRREELIAEFQKDDGRARIFVMSLRTGGLGLNLMQARHVFHFDQWWNPAVEDQATDRTHRIGQTQAVQVHKLVCAGTVEERIAEVVAGKRKLARQVIDASGGEKWITELGDEDLEELVSLSRSAIAL